ncbi:NAD binding domain of 6-phosphogluconate dehydrogenase-domain-containing protein [Aspergillus karnatakaensis]|uniref:NAD binding domain of 6-phosphogluconate dehydrogenase-domain-containing protein n=1 Tax=Aspergillus karnatakaensis TaxID=1810916 RepID=UPI003CCD92C5
MSLKPSIGFIGLGAMGIGMATHLLEDGYTVRGFDVNPAALQTLQQKGGIAAPSPRECAIGSGILVCMVANAAQTEDIFFSESRGAIFGLPAGATVILCSTVPPSFPGQLLQKIHGYGREDIQLVDCPVSGGTVRAAQGTLTILVSGSADGLQGAKGVLESLAETIYEIEGGLGSANKVKLVNQHLAGIHIAVAAEAMAFAASLGVNTRVFHDSVVGSEASSWMFENRVPHMLGDDWTPHSALGIFVKDMGIVTSEGLNQKIPLWLASAAEQLYLLGAQNGYDREDDSGIVRVFVPRTPSLVSNMAETARSDGENADTISSVKSLLEVVHTAAAVEALALANALGLSINSLVSIISNAAGASQSFKAVASKIVGGDFASGSCIAETRNKLVMNLAS